MVSTLLELQAQTKIPFALNQKRLEKKAGYFFDYVIDHIGQMLLKRKVISGMLSS